MPSSRKIFFSLAAGLFGLTLLAAEAGALTQDNRTGPFKPVQTTPYRFGYMPQPNVLPGTKPKKKCIPHGMARCIKRPLPPSPFAQLKRSSATQDARAPLMKRNQPILPEPYY